MSTTRAALLLLVGLASVARGDELSSADKLRILYSSQFSFTRDGYPVVTVRVMERQREVEIAAEGVRLLPDGEGGPEVRGGASWKVHAVDAKPARVRYWVVAERLSGAARARVAEARAAWRAKGHETQSFDTGTLFAVRGEVLDRRAAVIAIAPSETEAQARVRAEELARKKEVPAAEVFEELAEPPSGILEASDGRAVVRNAGVLWFAPAAADGRLTVLRVEQEAKPGAAPAREDRSYFGRLYVTLDRAGTLAVVNAVPENRLLAGLVPSEIFPSAPEEALKAQAVAARCELLAKIGVRHRTDPYLVCSTQHCQVYSGAGHEQPRTTAAVAATRGEVLFRSAGKDLVDTVYSASCGGHGESNENVWDDLPADPALRGHLDVADEGPLARFRNVSPDDVPAFLDATLPAYCRLSTFNKGDRYRWSVTRNAADLARLGDALGVGAIRGVEVLARGVSGRARAIRVAGATGETTVRGDLRIRTALGGLRSALFVVVGNGGEKGGELTFRGAGFGHGVGLCQTGAIGMAEAGRRYDAILRHYYADSTIRRLY